MMIGYRKGFTLIEVLVVTALIGILAAVVLASLGEARKSSQDASIKQVAASLRTQAELVYNSSGFSYANVCSNPRIQGILDELVSLRTETSSVSVDAVGSDTAVICNDSEAGYMIITPVNVPPNWFINSWCVDSTGWVGYTAMSNLFAANLTTCPSTVMMSA